MKIFIFLLFVLFKYYFKLAAVNYHIDQTKIYFYEKITNYHPAYNSTAF